MYPLQLIRITKDKGGNVWINPDQIIYAEQGKKDKDNDGDKKPGKQEFLTIIHIAGPEPKLFVKETPEEINKILRSMKHMKKVETTTTHQ